MDKKRGQAVLEALPILVMFFIVLSASLSFFEGQRNIVLTQISARNQAFQNIRNLGPLMMSAQSCFQVTTGGNEQLNLPHIMIVGEVSVNSYSYAAAYKSPGAACSN